MKLANKVALVTGGARGLGRAYVLHLARLGADVVINDVDLNAAQEYDEELTAESVAAEVEALGRRGLGIEADVADKAAVEAMMQEVMETFGQIDILVNNAGGMLYAPPNNTAATAPPDHYHYIMDINLTGTIFCCQAAAPHMQAARSGKIVNVASQAGLWSGHNAGGMAYKVAKAGVIHYTRVLAAELGPHNIHVNSIAPGYVLSSRAVAQGRNSPEVRDRLLQDIPLGRLGVPEDCAKVVEFLVTDLSDYVTGQCIPVCGGYVAF
ncbi:MAG: glucose 1-dehydrogenase [Caldilineaceae bacterium SB0661_bin_32]|uniref:Glucose 1-dehydrogenase n=1 Tax=Caldilineaceae bacterium SB0661_bin_32 TaxID=2605255 RepID=A0A6B1D5J2_9CHLR|nr:glucose 1-dehydrogenase [Caldilineaceae bacterium SB0661_bin_32]